MACRGAYPEWPRSTPSFSECRPLA
jgi:hypothetical protein